MQERAEQEKLCGLSLAPFYSDDSCTIFNCDIRECSDLTDIACLITSPPYNSNIDYGPEIDDAMPWSEYRELAEATCRVGAKALVSGGRAWINVAAGGSNTRRKRAHQLASLLGRRVVRGRTRPLGLRVMADPGARTKHCMGIVAESDLTKPAWRMGGDHRRVQRQLVSRSAGRNEGLAGRERRMDVPRYQRLADAARAAEWSPGAVPT